MILHMEELFKVYKVEHDDDMGLIYKPVSVYHVSDRKGVPFFLVYENLEWKYIEAEHFITATHMHYLVNAEGEWNEK